VSAAPPLPAPLRHPQQQAYLLLAAGLVGLVSRSGRNRDDSSLAEILTPLLRQSPHRRGVMPIGSLGTPLGTYRDCSEKLLLARDSAEGAAAIIGHLSTLLANYRETIDQAMVNRRLWFNGASPVDVVDLDIVLVTIGTIRRLGPGRVLDLAGPMLDRVGPIGRVNVELAFLMEPPNEVIVG
jgi:hypothetical protein